MTTNFGVYVLLQQGFLYAISKGFFRRVYEVQLHLTRNTSSC